MFFSNCNIWQSENPLAWVSVMISTILTTKHETKQSHGTVFLSIWKSIKRQVHKMQDLHCWVISGYYMDLLEYWGRQQTHIFVSIKLLWRCHFPESGFSEWKIWHFKPKGVVFSRLYWSIFFDSWLKHHWCIFFDTSWLQIWNMYRLLFHRPAQLVSAQHQTKLPSACTSLIRFYTHDSSSSSVMWKH